MDGYPKTKDQQATYVRHQQRRGMAATLNEHDEARIRQAELKRQRRAARAAD